MNSSSETEIRTLQVSSRGERLDKYLSTNCPDLSRSYLQKLVTRGRVLVNRKAARPGQRLKPGDLIQLALPALQPELPEAEDIGLQILYEDDDVAVIDKPADMTVHPAPGHKTSTLVNALLSRYPSMADTGAASRPGIVHRLDRDTSGVMVVAKKGAAWENLVNQFKTRAVRKTYLALVKGIVVPESGTIEAPIGRHPGNRKKMAVVEGGREARSRYKARQYFKGYTLLQIMPESGRTHQVRVHLKAIGFPVVGDTVYGIKWPYLRRQFLHAEKIGFYLPSSGVYREFTSDLPQDLQGALARLKPL